MSEKEGKIKISLQPETKSAATPAAPTEEKITQLPDWDLLPPRGLVRRPKNE